MYFIFYFFFYFILFCLSGCPIYFSLFLKRSTDFLSTSLQQRFFFFSLSSLSMTNNLLQMKLSVSALFTRDHHYKLSAFMLCCWSSCECFRDYWMRKHFSVWAPLICEVITGSFQLFSLNVSHVCSPSVWLSGSGVLSGGWLGGLVWKEKEGRIVIGWCRGANAVSRRGVSTQKGTERERENEKKRVRNCWWDEIRLNSLSASPHTTHT